MIAYFSIRRTNKRAHAVYVVQTDLNRGKRIEIRKIYHTRFFDIFSSLLDFRGFTCPRVLSGRWDGTKKDHASTPIWCVIHQTVRYESNLMLATFYLLRNHVISDWIIYGWFYTVRSCSSPLFMLASLYHSIQSAIWDVYERT